MSIDMANLIKFGLAIIFIINLYFEHNKLVQYCVITYINKLSKQWSTPKFINRWKFELLVIFFQIKKKYIKKDFLGG